MSKYTIRRIDTSDPQNLYTKIIKLVGKNKKVIDFGCSSGFLAEALKENNNCRVWGLELDQEDAEKAKAFCEAVFVKDLDNLNWQKDFFPNRPFDVAIFADVIEHIKHPLEVLIKTKELLGEKGSVVISIPNIAHASIRMEILAGSFEYEELGILDNTHLHLYTKKTACELLESAGFFVELVDTNPLDFSEEYIDKFLKSLNLKRISEKKNLFLEDEAKTVQYIIKANVEKPKNYISWKEAKFLKPADEYKKIFEYLKNELERNKDLLKLKEEEIKKKNEELKRLYSSKYWKIVKKLKGLRNKIFG